MTLLSVSEAAAQAGLSVSHVRQLVADGMIKGRKYGKTWILEEPSLEAYLAAGNKPGPKPQKGKPKKKSIDKHRRYRQ